MATVGDSEQSLAWDKTTCCITSDLATSQLLALGSLPATPGSVQPSAPGQEGVLLVVPVPLSTLDGITRIRAFMPKDQRHDQAAKTV